MYLLLANANFFFGKRVISQTCGFFEHFLALFDPFTTRYNDPGIKFEFFDKF